MAALQGSMVKLTTDLALETLFWDSLMSALRRFGDRQYYNACSEFGRVEGDEVEQPSSEKAYLEIERAVEEMTLSIHAMAGTQAPNTFKVLGKVKGIAKHEIAYMRFSQKHR